MSAVPVSRAPLTVVSYNIHRGVGRDGHADTERIARVVQEISPDLLALQEVDSGLEGAPVPGQLERLHRMLGLECVSGVTLRREDAAYGNAVFSRLPIRRVRLHDISVDGVEPRGVIDLDLDLPEEPVRLLATHLGLRSSERRHQVARLSSILERNPDLPLVLVGDFNDGRSRWGPLSDLGRRFGRWSGPRTYPARRPLLRLDRILADPGRWDVERVWAHRSALASRASDHLPVCARMRLRSRSDRCIPTG